jgi:hypothetical protein
LRITFNQKACLTFLLFTFAAVIFCLTFGLGRVARMVPFAVVVPTLLLLLFQLLMDLLPRLAQKYSQLEKKDLFSVEGLRKQVRNPAEDAKVEPTERNREGKAFLWLLAMFGLIYLLGAFIAIPFYTLLYLKRHSEKWLTSIAVTLGICGLVYAMSVFDSGAWLYEGLLWKLLKI